MNDRELLELAAKAAGIEIYESVDGTIQNRPVWVFLAGGAMGTMPYEEQWNPLRDDATALRLAVKLFMTVEVWAGSSKHHQGVTHVEHDDVSIEEPHNGDANAATRRAIVRAAAEIAKAGEKS